MDTSKPSSRGTGRSRPGESAAVRCAARLAFALLLGAWAVPDAAAQALPLEIRQDPIRFNLSSTNGLPISTVRGTPPGSDGRGPTLAQQQAAGLTEVAATANQFRGFVSFGAVARPGTTNLNPALSLGANAERLDLPRIKVNGAVVMSMPRARITPFLGRAVSFLFGEVIPRPDKDEFGVLLSTVNTNISPNRPAQSPETYWLPEPYTTANHTNGGYYWSPHAQAVFAVNPGPLLIAWRRSIASTAVNPPSGVANVLVLGVPYVVATNQYVVSGSPVKDPRLMYWTERSFVDTGKPVTVPSARVGTVNIVYNNIFPARVANEVEIPGAAPITTSNTLQELRTLWYDDTSGQAGGQIRAYNAEGRVFVELLGDVQGPNTRQHLGFEIVDVVKQPVATDVTIELGERLTSYPGDIPSDAGLFPEPLLLVGQSFTFQHTPGGGTRPNYYAIRETRNQNDLQFHWLEEGLEGLRWPFRFVRYKQVWPDDVSKYSHYIRPLVATEAEAKATAVPLPSQNAPSLAYQDPLDQPRGKLTENFAYYSFLDIAHPAHRALLRFTSGEFIRFERVFSWLDQGLRDRNAPPPAVANNDLDLNDKALEGSVATNLTWVVGSPGFAVRNIRATIAPCDIITANNVLANPSLQASVFTETAPVVNYLSTGSSANFGGDASFPDFTIGVDDDYFVTEATGIVTIPTGGFWTFGVNSDDGFRCEIGTNVFEFAAPRGPADTLATFDLPAGRHSVRLVFFECNGGAAVEFFASAGSHTAFNSGFRLVGDTARGGLEIRSKGGPNSPAPDIAVRPRIVSGTVFVGDRITAPVGEIGNAPDTNYLAGFIRTSEGDLYHPGAYVDPFTGGFEAANRGAIIPVNAVPGKDRLEVWWFRRNQINVAQGFQPSFWPAVLARYTVQYPDAPAEIVLASNDGSGPLLSLQARGSIYYQNDPALPGYNPNEEHALVQGGQAFALRDDLNVTTPNGYTSRPFVLLDYIEADGRPTIRAFKVLREKPEVGITFDYAKDAGTILQPPMPLPLLEKPFAPNIAGQPPKSLNTEIQGYEVASSTQAGAGAFSNYVVTTTARHFIKQYDPVALQNPAAPGAPYWLLPTTVGPTSVAGPLSLVRPLQLRPWGGSQTTISNRWRFAATLPPNLLANVPGLLYDTVAKTNWFIQLNVVDNTSQYVEVQIRFASFTPDAAKNANLLVLAVEGPAVNAFAGQRLASEPLPTTIADANLRDFYGKFTLQDRKGNTWFYRGPHTLAESPSLVMQFYYKTLPGFFFPTLALDQQPPVGTVTPYLRPLNANGSFEGDPVYANVKDSNQDADGNALGITYRPVWPENVPVLQMAETLTTPKRGLPAVRGQTSLEILYQQSQISGGEAHESALLHDPIREKTFVLGALDNGDTLDGIPPSVKTQSYQGRTYFPNLPPHLAERVFFDPNRGEFGELVFKGQFVDAALGDKYIFLNVLGQGDAAELKSLCVAEDSKKALWDAAIDGLATTLETFIENPAQPRTYIPSAPEVIGAGEIARIKNDDVAVEANYALTATGPGTGYVSLIAGNGRAFTPEGDPVSVAIVKVVPTLYRGEVNIVESSNPLNEKLTMQQVVDLAAKIEDYDFEWLIASPVDGLPPVVYQNAPRTLLPDGVWSHLRFPLAADKAASVSASAANRLFQDVSTTVSPVSRISYDSVALVDGKFRFHVPASPEHGLSTGNRVVLRKTDGAEVFGTVNALTTATDIYVSVDPNQNISTTANEILELNERVTTNGVQSIVFRQFDQPAGNYSQYWLSMDLDAALGAVVYIDGQLAVRANTGQNDSTTTSPPGGLFPLSRVYRLSDADLAGGTVNPDGSRTHTIAVELISGAFPGQFIAFNARIEAFTSIDVTAQQWLPLDADRYPDKVRAVLGGSADVRSLADNYLIMRYQAKNPDHASFGAWSQWTTPQLAEGWIKRVLKGINPFNQRITDLFNNSVNTDVSIVAQAGQRWEGDVALNLDALNSVGLIEIYETVLNRGKMLSIGGGINYGPANDALLLAAGYLNDLYMVLGNEAWADASNPTIGIGTAHNTYGAVATALFSFKGQLPSVLEEELALMRGRDDFLLPGVELRPVYNRMVWNYTRGIDAGEVIYALNYNVLDQNTDGVVNADDARRLYPQGHGDAYGHYLTALKGYYALLMNTDFDWVPRIEAVTVLGKPVSVDYQDERKFAAAAGALARAGKQTFDLTWRRDYQSGKGNGWSHLATTKANATTRSLPTTRYWGMDHWASRTGQGAYLNWVVGNAILPDRDPDPTHQGSIQQIDRTTVPELQELVSVSASLQAAMDNAEAGHTPLGLPSTTIPFDLNPNAVVGNESNTHFEQVYSRAKRALNNAIVSFDDAKDVTRLMRSEEDSLADFRTTVNKQELAYTNALIELYGTPYPEDIGPGRTYRTGYNGPDSLHYMYVDTKEINFNGLLNPAADTTFIIDTQTFQPGWAGQDLISTFGWIEPAFIGEVDGTGRTEDYLANTNLFIQYNLSAHGFFRKPESWTGQRSAPGRVQQAISDVIKARNAAFAAFYWADAAKYDLDWAIASLEQKKASQATIRGVKGEILRAQVVIDESRVATETLSAALQFTAEQLTGTVDKGADAIPTSFIAGLAFGGDLFSGAKTALKIAGQVASDVIKGLDVINQSVQRHMALATETANRYLEYDQIAPEEFNQQLREAVSTVRDKVYGMNNNFMTVNMRLQELDDAQRKYRSLLAEGERIQQERQIFRQRAAAVIQGYRTRDAAFRIFRNEKLERYKTLFDLAAQYAFMAAQAYDYETGLLHSDQGKEFINRIVRARALGVVQGGEPQFAGSNTGDPGLSSAMAEMFADWSVLKGRLGFNNPDAYGTTVSLRTEQFRILPGTNGNNNWKDVLNQALKANVLDDPDVRRYCLQLNSANGLPVPGLVIEFSTTIGDGLNLFGRPLAAGDHAYSPSSFATKIFAAGVALEGYQGMDDPSANSGAVAGSGGSSPPDPDLAFLDPDAMSATPYIYLVPVGVDSMRSPPLGDVSDVRNWSVDDVAIPLPFNIGGSEFSNAQLYQSGDSLSEAPFAIRKHQAFRPVSSASVFSPDIYTATGGLTRSQFTNNRLIGRSVWNSKWKIVIPGQTLLNNPDDGLERFIRTVKDVKLHFVTYSYSGN